MKKPKSLKIIQVDPLNPRDDHIVKSFQIIKDGGVIVFPTQYLYGLGADALNVEAVDKVFEIKQRSYHKPLLILIPHRQDLKRLVQHVSSAAVHIMNCFWPGAVTLVFKAKDTVPENLTANTGKVGIRMPQHPVALALSRAVGGPLTATSANITGDSGCSTVSDIDLRISDNVDLILDAGPLKGGTGSTVVDVTIDPPKILRDGAIPAKDIFIALEDRQARLP
ncbi:MAG: threonylcarbamoyl-AMP synthase [Deltaproteobacteria bacterium]|nr:threonylcarbamoyl-AMP synthase [Deltaproteobacteria bacterium]